MASFKIYFSEENIRRIRVAEIPSYEEFMALLQELYPKFHPELSLKYVDEDGDKISLSTQLEWEEMLMELSGQSSIKLLVEEGDGKYFKDGPEPEVLKFYADRTTKDAIEVANEWMAALQEKVPQCLSSLFPSGKIIPSHIPAFLKAAVSMKYVQDNTVDLDIDIHKLFDSLHTRALQLLDSVDMRDLEQAREYLEATLTLIPDHFTALYNLACAESLMGNVNNALYYLEKSIDNGYRNLSHMIQDADFQNIRDTEAFQILTARLASLTEFELSSFYPSQPEPEQVVETIPEPVVISEPEPKPVELSASILPLKDNFGEELNLLSEMGFTADPDVLLLLLDQYNGNVDDVAQFLLGFSQ